MQSVYEKHKAELDKYVKAMGALRGRAVYAMAILSDCKEMIVPGSGVSIGRIRDELDEVKELLADIAKLE